MNKRMVEHHLTAVVTNHVILFTNANHLNIPFICKVLFCFPPAWLWHHLPFPFGQSSIHLVVCCDELTSVGGAFQKHWVNNHDEPQGVYQGESQDHKPGDNLQAEINKNTGIKEEERKEEVLKLEVSLCSWICHRNLVCRKSSSEKK